jgi:hypothetical protein
MFVWSRDVRWPASIFFRCFLIVQEVDPWPSPDSNKSQIFSLSWVLVLDLHRLHGCWEEHHSCSRSNVVVKKNIWSGQRISRRTIQLFFLSSQLTEVPKNQSHSRLIQEHLFSHILFRWHAQSHWSILPRVASSSSYVDRKWRSENFLLAAISIAIPSFFNLNSSLDDLDAQQKSLTVIIVLLEGRLKRRKEIVGRFDFLAQTQKLSTI